jgi:hypothetical protein
MSNLPLRENAKCENLRRKWRIEYLLRVSKKTVILLFLFLICFGANAQSPPSVSLGEVETKWKGVKLNVSQILRLDDRHILVVIRIELDASAQNPTLIGFMPKVPDGVSTVEASSSKYDPQPFDLTSTTMIDNSTKKVYQAEPSLPASPFLGPNGVIMSCVPNAWIQLAVELNAPPPLPPDASGIIPKQTVSFSFPNAKTAMKDVVLPFQPIKPPKN